MKGVRGERGPSDIERSNSGRDSFIHSLPLSTEKVEALKLRTLNVILQLPPWGDQWKF